MILLALLLASASSAGRSGAMRPYADLFFMGAAFLLLETKNVATSRCCSAPPGWSTRSCSPACSWPCCRGRDDPPVPNTAAAGPLSPASPLALALAYVDPEASCSRCPFCRASSRRRSLAFLPIFLANVAFAKRFAEPTTRRRRSA